MSEHKNNSGEQKERLDLALVGYSHIVGLIAILFIVCVVAGHINGY